MEDEIRELEISDKEFEALNKCTPEVRYQYTLKRIADAEAIWLLWNDEDGIVIQAYDEECLLPMWSSREYAQAFCVGDFKDCKCKAVTLDYFVEYVVDVINEDNLLIDVFPTQQEGRGKVVDLNTFAEDLNKYLEDYEESVQF
jgi:hypothetical protein